MSAKELKFEGGILDWETDNYSNTVNLLIKEPNGEIWANIPYFSSFEKANEFLEKTVPEQLEKGETKKFSKSIVYTDKEDTKSSYTTATLTFKYYKAKTLIIDLSKFTTHWEGAHKTNSKREAKTIKLGKRVEK